MTENIVEYDLDKCTFVRATPENVKPGDWVRGEASWGTGSYVFHNLVYKVKSVKDGLLGIEACSDGHCAMMNHRVCNGGWNVSCFDVMTSGSPEPALKHVKDYDIDAVFDQATLENVHAGSYVRGNARWGVGPYIFHNRVYIVKEVYGGGLRFHACSSHAFKHCTCFFTIDTFEVLRDWVPTPGDIAQAVPLPTVEDALRFFRREA